MEEKNKGLNINIEHYTGEKPIEVVYRLGDAAQAQQPLATKAPEKISVSGTISTPYEWLSKRIDTVDQKRANVVVNREKMTIQLTVNEDDYYNKNTFTGTVEVSETFEKFGINDGEKGWIPAKLGQFLRLNRGLFEDKEKCMVLVSNLKNFNAKAKAEIEKQRDPSGSVADVYRCQVESNLPKSFTVNMAIFKGTAKQPIEIEFDHYLTNGEVFLQLVSPGANEVMEVTEISVLMKCWIRSRILPPILQFWKCNRSNMIIGKLGIIPASLKFSLWQENKKLLCLSMLAIG